MKFSLVAALVVVLAVAHGTEASSSSSSSSSSNRESELDRLIGLINSMSARLSGITQGLLDRVKSQPRLLPLVDRVQAEAARLQQQMMPVADNIPAEVKQLSDMVEKFYQQVMDQTKALRSH